MTNGMRSFLVQPPFFRGLAIVLLALAGLISLHHQAEHFGRASDCPVCLQAPTGAASLPSAGVCLIPTVERSSPGSSRPDAIALVPFVLPSASRAPPAASA